MTNKIEERCNCFVCKRYYLGKIEKERNKRFEKEKESIRLKEEQKEEEKKELEQKKKKEKYKFYEKTYNDAYKNWRDVCIIRDKSVCQDCKDLLIKKEKHIHHIKHKFLYPELIFRKSNGVTLCKECHQKRHPELKIEIGFKRTKPIKPY